MLTKSKVIFTGTEKNPKIHKEPQKPSNNQKNMK
jgi:hypothetical protein